MRKILLFCVLFSIASLTYAQTQTCPPAPEGYIFRVGAWGDHVNEYSDVRCYYYSGNKQIEKNAGVWVNEAAFANYPKWSHLSKDHYLLCSPATDVNDCPFDA